MRCTVCSRLVNVLRFSTGVLIASDVDVQILDWHEQCASIQYFDSPGHATHDVPLRSVPVEDMYSDEYISSSEDEEEAAGHEGLLYLRKVLITPLRVLPYPATPEESNRILRQYVSNYMAWMSFSVLHCTWCL